MTDAIGAPLTRRTHTRNDSMLAATGSSVPADVAASTELAHPSASKAVEKRPGRLIVEYFGDLGPATRHLDMVPVRTMVTAMGTISKVGILGDDMNPRAVVCLTGGDGESAQCTVDTEHYLDLFDYLVEGTFVVLRGTVRRPLSTMPALIDVMVIRSADELCAQAGVTSA
ncbi:hypothetical protein ACFUIW_33605 [Streptomyces sp. NPDC057245]|uniref:hypothetical protein n=1 Tax=Streptomyces TaxID=1883 RepID=UPI003625BD99